MLYIYSLVFLTRSIFFLHCFCFCCIRSPSFFFRKKKCWWKGRNSL